MSVDALGIDASVVTRGVGQQLPDTDRYATGPRHRAITLVTRGVADDVVVLGELSLFFVDEMTPTP